MAQGLAVLVGIMAVPMVSLIARDTSRYQRFQGSAKRLGEGAVAYAGALCASPVEVDDGREARLACATDLRIRACGARALDAVRLRDAADGLHCEVTRGGMRASWRLMTGHPVDLNQASEADLAMLPGLTARQAAAIVEFRRAHGPFTEVEDLTAVPGIAAATAHNLAPWLAEVL